jgi:uncharacterized membrane protein YfhO
VLLPGAAADDNLPVFDGCDNDRILCRDMAALKDHHQRGLDVTRGPNEVRVAWSPVEGPTVLVVAEMFRPGWIATSGDRTLTARPVFGGLIGVPLPNGAAEVRLTYRPVVPRVAIVVSWLAVIAAIVMIVWPVPSKGFPEANRPESAKESGRSAALD